MRETAIKRPNGLYGAEGIVCSIIAQAADDAIGRGGNKYIADAWAYLGGDDYRHQVELLGLSPDSLPAAVDSLSVDELKQLYARIDND